MFFHALGGIFHFKGCFLSVEAPQGLDGICAVGSKQVKDSPGSCDPQGCVRPPWGFHTSDTGTARLKSEIISFLPGGTPGK